jgi:type I restriction enzyme S subunit
VVSQQVGQANVNGTKLQAFVFPMPPQSEQSRILADVERRLSIIDEHEILVERDLIRADRLRQAILKNAFAGKLVPQHSSDAPASVLLERIHAERDAQAAKQMSRKSAGKLVAR